LNGQPSARLQLVIPARDRTAIAMLNSAATRPALVSSGSGISDSLGVSVSAGAGQDFNALRRECGTAPGGATRRSPRSRRPGENVHAEKTAVHELLKDEAWFADADSPLDTDLIDDCPSPTLFLSEPSPSLFGDMGIRDVFDAADPDEVGSSSDLTNDVTDSPKRETITQQHSSPAMKRAERGGSASAITGSSGSANGLTPRSGSGRARVEGGMNLSPRGSFERGKKQQRHRTQNGVGTSGREPESAVLKGLLNSAEMEDRLAAAQQVNKGGTEARPPRHACFFFRPALVPTPLFSHPIPLPSNHRRATPTPTSA